MIDRRELDKYLVNAEGLLKEKRYKAAFDQIRTARNYIRAQANAPKVVDRRPGSLMKMIGLVAVVILLTTISLAVFNAIDRERKAYDFEIERLGYISEMTDSMYLYCRQYDVADNCSAWAATIVETNFDYISNCLDLSSNDVNEVLRNCVRAVE